MRRVSFITVIAAWVSIAASDVGAQHWKKVFTLPTIGSAACFVNQNEGCIGSGSYPGGNPAQIYYTTDGGGSWTRSLMPNLSTLGQITDIYFRDRLNGWATLRETFEHGWSGIYRTFDGGRSWQLWYQAEFPVSIREIPNGIFFTDRFSGIRRSSDGGNTFQLIVQSAAALGLDFRDDKTGIFSTEGNSEEPYCTTIDGGNTWVQYPLPREAWSTFGDPASKRLFVASEREVPYPGTESYIGYTDDNGNSFKQVLVTDTSNDLIGAISGNRGCTSVIYVQRQFARKGNTKLDDGLMRSTDGGITWIAVSGPYNSLDKRFAVTGRGAVVFAFDKAGGVWKTSDGGDGTLSPSSLDAVHIAITQTANKLSATLCDSAAAVFRFNYSACDSVSILRVAFVDDTAGELSATHRQVFFGKSGTIPDSITVKYKPRKTGTSTRQIRLTFLQGDGYVQDTVVTLNIQGNPAQDVPLIQEVAGNLLDFGSQSICSGDSVRTVTITNAGCAPMEITDLSIGGSPFTLLSSFAPISLDPGTSRQYLIRFKPTGTGPQNGSLLLQTGNARDSVFLKGDGRLGGRGYTLAVPRLVCTMCDSTSGLLVLRNTSCTPVRLDSLSVPVPFRLDPFVLPLVLPTDSEIVLNVHFVPNAAGTFTVSVAVHSFNINDRFDTTLSVSATATEGAASVQYSAPRLDFDSVSVCSARELLLTIVSTGCDTLSIPIDSLTTDPAEFQIVSDVGARRVLRGDTVRILVKFHPPGTGFYTSMLHIETNAGPIDIPVTGYGSSDPGKLTLSTPTLGTILTCKDTTFSLTLENTTCDSLTLDSIAIGGNPTLDYTLSVFAPTGLTVGSSFNFPIRFGPQGNGLKAAVVHCYLHKNDKTLLEIDVPLQGSGLQPVPIRLSLPNISYTSLAGTAIQIPVSVLDTSYVDVRSVTVRVKVRTDLLTPTAFDVRGSIFPGATVRSFTVQGDSVVIVIDIPAGERPHNGLLGTLDCDVFVTDTIMTDIIPSGFVASDASASSGCLPTAIVSPPQSVTSFTLTPECGTPSLVYFLAHKGSGILIDRIAPDPTHSEISFTAWLNPLPANELVIDILSDDGTLVQQERIAHSDLRQKFDHTITLIGASGARTLRLRSDSFEATGRFVLLR